jgi:hypothetical protein
MRPQVIRCCLLIFGMGILYETFANIHFGCHWFSKSDAEMLSYGIFVLIMAIGVAVLAFAKKE